MPRIPERYIVMMFVCLFTLAFMCQTCSPAAIQHELIKQLNLTNSQYSGLFSVSSWASLLDTVSSYIIEKWLGLKLACFIYTAIMIFGNLLYIIAAFTDSFVFMIIGRLTFGIGGNPMIVCMNVFITNWFKDKELNLMYSLYSSIIWFATSISFLASERLITYISSFAWIKSRMNLSITVCTLTILYTIIIIISATALGLMYKNKIKVNSESTGEEQKNHEKSKNDVTLKRMLNFHPVIWVNMLTDLLYFTSVIGLVAMSQVFFKTKYQVSVQTSSDLSSVFTFVIFIGSPIIGALIDYFGRNLQVYTAGIFLAILGHSMLAFTTIHPLAPIVILGVSVAAASSCYAMVQLIVEPHQLTMVLGISQTVAEFAIGLGGITAGSLADHFGYLKLPLLYFSLTACCLPLLALTWYMNNLIKNPFSISAKERRRRIESSETTKLENKVTSGESTPPTTRKEYNTKTAV